MNPQEELNQLLERQEALHQELKERKKELLEAQRIGRTPSNARSGAPNPASPPPSASAAPAG